MIALIVTPEGFPLAYEVMPSNTSDKTTLADFLKKIEVQYGKSQRVWVMDRGIPTEATLALMRQSETPVHYLVGTPRGRLTKLGAAKKEAGKTYALVNIALPKDNDALQANGFGFSLRKDKLRQVRRREGRYLLRSNLTQSDPAALWEYYIQLTEIEQAFKELKSDLAIRPIYHQLDHRIEAHIFVAFIAYCLQVTLKQRARSLAPGLTPRAVLEKFVAVQMVDVHLPTTDGRHLILSRYTQPEKDLQLLLSQLKLALPEQLPPKIKSAQ